MSTRRALKNVAKNGSRPFEIDSIKFSRPIRLLRRIVSRFVPIYVPFIRILSMDSHFGLFQSSLEEKSLSVFSHEAIIPKRERERDKERRLQNVPRKAIFWKVMGGRGRVVRSARRGEEGARLERSERSRCACGTERFHISSQALRNVPTRLVSVSINAITRSLV